LNTPIVIAAVVVGASVAIYFIYKNSTSTHTVGYEKRKLKDRETVWQSTNQLPKLETEGNNYNRSGTRRESISGESVKEEDLMRVPSNKVYHEKDEATRVGILDMIKDSLIFRNLDAQQRDELINAMFEKKVTQGESVIVQGDEGDFFYLVSSGAFDILVNGKKVAEASKGKSFGELALLYGQPRAATVTATENSLVWAVDRATFRRVVLASNFRKRKQHEKFLKEVPILSSLNPEELVKAADALHPVSFEPNDKIITEGETGETFYIVVDGEAVVSKGGQEVGKKTKGEYFGEIALLTDGVRVASITAATKVDCLVLDKHAFTRLLGPCVDILKRNMENYKQYEKQIN